MFRLQFSLRALVGVLTLAACVLGVGIPIYRHYQRTVAVTRIRTEVEHCLTEAAVRMKDHPEYVELDLKVLREQIRRTPILNDAERGELEGVTELALRDCARLVEIERSEEWRYSCGVAR